MSALREGMLETARIWTPVVQIGLVGSFLWLLAGAIPAKTDPNSIVKDGELVNWPIDVDE